jgi:hypothetical protein
MIYNCRQDYRIGGGEPALWPRTARRATGGILYRFEFPNSNRQFLVRLETSVTSTKQTPEFISNRHFWEGGPLVV